MIVSLNDSIPHAERGHMKNFDVAVVGNGILGLATAYTLIQKDQTLKIAIIGKSPQTATATTAAGAMLGCFGEVTQATFTSRYGLAKLQIAARAKELWPSWLSQINSLLEPSLQIEITQGTFIILNTLASHREDDNYAAIRKALTSYKTPYEDVDPRSIPGLKPIDNCRPLRALYIPNENGINPCSLLHGLHTVLSRHKNVVFFDHNAMQIDVTAGTTHGVTLTDKSVVNTTQVLLAAGAASQFFIDKIPEIKKFVPRIIAGFGCALKIEFPDHGIRHVIRSPNRAGSCGIHMLPYGATSIYMGATNSLGLEVQDKARLKDGYYLIERALEQFNQDFYKAMINEWIVGNRPVTIDTFPLIGRTSIKGLWMATGSYRDGFHTAPLISMILAEQILGKESPFDHPFHPERPPIQTMTKQQAIDEFVSQAISAAHEHSISLPKLGWSDMLENSLRIKAEEIYARLECNIGLPADILAMLEQNYSLIPFFKGYYASLPKENLYTAHQQTQLLGV